MAAGFHVAVHGLACRIAEATVGRHGYEALNECTQPLVGRILVHSRWMTEAFWHVLKEAGYGCMQVYLGTTM